MILPMRVLHVITGLGAGGAETQLRLFIRNSRHRAEVVALYNAGSVADRLREDGVSVTDLGMRSNKQIGAVFRLARIIRRGGFDVVHTHLYRACLYGRIAARLAGVRLVVATEHSLLDDQLEGRSATPGVRWLYRLSERLGRTTIAVSDPVRANLLRWGVAPERVVTVPNGLDLAELAFDQAARTRVRAELGIPPSAAVVGAVGRLHPGKRFDVLLAALAPTLGPDRHLLVVGEGSERGRLTDTAAALGVTGHVHLVGEQQVAPYLSAMDVLVSPSRYETFGLAVVEGLAAGLTVLHRRCPALAALGGTAPSTAVQLSENEDLPSAVDAALRVRAADRRCPPELRSFDIATVAARIDDLYERLA
jgi:glycosyltransferase involved in cell wall biosynthesis